MNSLKKFIQFDWAGGVINGNDWDELEIAECIDEGLVESKVKLSAIDLNCNHELPRYNPTNLHYICKICGDIIPLSDCLVERHLKVIDRIPFNRSCQECFHSVDCALYLSLKKTIERTKLSKINNFKSDCYVPEFAGKEDPYAPIKSLAQHCQDYKIHSLSISNKVEMN